MTSAGLLAAFAAADLAAASGPLENPSAGLVPFPVEAVKDAAAIDVRPNAAAGVKHFRLNGLAAATAFMQERKCVDYSW